MRTASVLVAVVVATAGAASAHADVLRVPADHATIQLAVDAAEHGDRIVVRAGTWCGATITKEVHLVGVGATIVGCDAPALGGGLRIGFFLPGAEASGSSVRGFAFDGAGVGAGALAPLAFAVFARDADDVVVTRNVVFGTVQAITNTRGSGWYVSRNLIVGLTALPCDGSGPCGGGSGIVMQNRDVGARSSDNRVLGNAVSGSIPDGLAAFDMAGIVFHGQSHSSARHNAVRLDRGDAPVRGIGVLVANECCGDAPFSTSEHITVIGTLAPETDVAVWIAPGNAVGARVRHTVDAVVIDEALP